MADTVELVYQLSLIVKTKTKTEKMVRACAEKWIPNVYSLRRQNGTDKNLSETQCYDDRLDEEQRHGIWTYDRED